MIAIGTDVGKRTGLAVLDFSGARPRHLVSGALQLDNVDALQSLQDDFFADHDPIAVGIETPTQVFEHGRASKSKGARIGIERNLLIATRAAGVVWTIAMQRHLSVFEEQAHAVRKAVFGHVPRTGIDAFISEMIPRFIDGWPKRSNDHERDAAVVALFAANRMRPFGRAR